jgi:hypothetical protein
MAGSGCSLKGAIGGDGGFTSGSVDVPPAVGRGQEAGGEVVVVACLRRRKRGGKRKGWAASVTPFIDVAGGRGRRGGGPGWSSHGGERDGRGEGGPSAAVGDRPVADGRRAHVWHGAEYGRPGAD